MTTTRSKKLFHLYQNKNIALDRHLQKKQLKRQQLKAKQEATSRAFWKGT